MKWNETKINNNKIVHETQKMIKHYHIYNKYI